MNWGYGILCVIILFVSGIVGLVVLSSQQDIEMMDDHYYERELLHQNLINGEENLNNARGVITVKDSLTFLVVAISGHVVDKLDDGKIVFLRPSDQRLDRTIELNPEKGQQIIDKSLFIRGEYQARFSWSNDGRAFYQQVPVIIK